MKVGVPMTPEMVGWIDAQAKNMSNSGLGTSRADIIRECVARVAFDYFDRDVE